MMRMTFFTRICNVLQSKQRLQKESVLLKTFTEEATRARDKSISQRHIAVIGLARPQKKGSSKNSLTKNARVKVIIIKKTQTTLSKGKNMIKHYNYQLRAISSRMTNPLTQSSISVSKTLMLDAH